MKENGKNARKQTLFRISQTLTVYVQRKFSFINVDHIAVAFDVGIVVLALLHNPQKALAAAFQNVFDGVIRSSTTYNIFNVRMTIPSNQDVWIVRHNVSIVKDLRT